MARRRAWHGLSVCRRFTLTNDAFDAVLAHLSRVTDTDAMYNLNRLVAWAPVGLLIAHQTAILDTPNISQETASLTRMRREFAEQSAEQLWEGLQDFARRSDDKKHVGEIDHGHADALVDALASHEVPDAKTICLRLSTIEEDEGWLPIFLIELAGERRIHEAVPILVDIFRIDTDYTLARCSEALAKMGDPEAARLIRRSFPAESWRYKNYTAPLLGEIKTRESEEMILSLLEAEEDSSIRTSLCYGLCRLFSERGVDRVRREIHSGYDAGLVNLEESLLPVLHVLGIDLPEADQWRGNREERARLRERRRRELEHMGRQHAALKQQGIDPFANLGGPQKPAVRESTSLRRFSPRVGRNDPCPCGSSKKYKRCCGRE